MSFTDAIKTGFAKYATFEGRAPRSEYWYWVLFAAVAGTVLYFIHEYLYWAFVVATFLPGLAVTVRRLHDIGRSGWWWFLVFVPIVGAVVLLIWMCTRSEAESNRFGANPFGAPPPLPA